MGYSTVPKERCCQCFKTKSGIASSKPRDLVVDVQAQQAEFENSVEISK